MKTFIVCFNDIGSRSYFIVHDNNNPTIIEFWEPGTFPSNIAAEIIRRFGNTSQLARFNLEIFIAPDVSSVDINAAIQWLRAELTGG